MSQPEVTSTPPAPIYRCQRCGKPTPYRMMMLLMCVACQPDCATCGKVGESGDDACANCWEVERRLPDYLRTEKGRAFVAQLLRESTQ